MNLVAAERTTTIYDKTFETNSLHIIQNRIFTYTFMTTNVWPGFHCTNTVTFHCTNTVTFHCTNTVIIFLKNCAPSHFFRRSIPI